MSEESKDEKLKRILADFRRAYEYKKDLLEMMQEDFEFALGKQWDDNDVETLRDRGVRALTINKIRPIVKLMVGLEAQNRSDIKAFPEGAEDSITAEIATRLYKNVMKRSKGDYKVSEMFGDGIIGGEGWLEPWMDYTNDLLNGELKWRKVDYYNVFPDPSSREYDLSDAEYVSKVTYDLTADQLVQLYPEKEKEIRVMSAGGKIELQALDQVRDASGVVRQTTGYEQEEASAFGDDPTVPTFDLLEHYYKKYVPRWYVIDLALGSYKLADNEEEAKKYVEFAGVDGSKTAKAIKKVVPEIWVCSMTGGLDEYLYEGPAWTYPKWKSYPLFPYWCERIVTRLSKTAQTLGIQGFTRGLKDLNREINKRRTQELLHLNSTANSGWISEEGAFTDEGMVKKFGSTPGVIITHKKGTPKPERIYPMQLSTGHAQLADQANQDIKEAGVNADLLALQEGGQASGRAIALRQKQGLVMVQGVFDNLSQTKKNIGLFVLSQLSEIYTTDEVIRVLGNAFIKENFSEPVMVADPVTGQPGPQLDPSGELVMQVNPETVSTTINAILNDTEMGKYDVAVGEAISSDTIKFANYLMLTEMAQSGLPVPPDVLVDESNLPEASKKKIREAYMRQQQAQPQPMPKRKGA